nr:MAG TPA: bacterial regulatory protein [Caudoviricetes sp.]
MHRAMGIPVRTIENWEGGQRECPEWAERLIVAELERIAEKAASKNES